MTHPAALTADGGPNARSQQVITAALLLLTTMIAFENMAVATAMPVVAAELGAVESYGLAFSTMMTAMLLGIVLAGPWTDRAGPLPPVVWGQALFAGGAILCGAAPSFGALLLGRVVTGLGAGLVIVVEFVIVGRAFAPADRPRVFSYISAAWILPSLVGGPIAGWLATTVSWRWVFWVVVLPAGLGFALFMARRDALRGAEPTPLDGDAGAEAGRQDHRRTARLGALVAVSAGLVQLAFHEHERLMPWMSGIGLLGLLGVALSAPRLLPEGTFRSARGLPSIVLTRGLLNGSFLGGFAYLPLMLTRENGLTPAVAGLVLAVGSLGWSAGSWAQGRSARRGIDERAHLVVAGAGMLAVGWAAFVGLTLAHAPVWAYGLVIVLGGLGMGLGSTTLSGLVLEVSPDHEHGRASAALQLSDVLGTVVGLAGATAAFAATHIPGEHRGYVVVWVGLAAFGALGILSASRCASAGPLRPRDDVTQPSP